MDKNMIKIDDLLKQRLSDGEDNRRPGAWLQMRELLDKEMPVTSVPGSAVNWRRMFSYLAGLALLATVSVGGYEVATSFRNTEDAETAKTVAAVANTPARTSANTTSNTENNTLTASANNSSDNNNQSDNKNNQDNIAKTIALSTTDSYSGNKAGKSATNNNNQPKNEFAANNTVANTSKTASENTVSNSSNKLINSSKDNVTETVASKNNTATQPKTEIAKKEATVTSQRSYASGNMPGKSLPSKANSGNNTSEIKPQGTAKQNSSVTAAATTNNNNTIKQTMPAPVNPAEHTPAVAKEDNKQLIDKVETREKYDRTNGWKKDTVATGKIEWPKEKEQAVAMASNKNLITVNPEIVPGSAMGLTNSTVKEELVPLANFRVDSKGKSEHYQKQRRFEQMIQNAKMGMGGAKFNAGMILGGNYSPTSDNNLYGFQFGLTGVLSLNEKWGILSELKYMQRYRNESSIGDPYIDNITSQTIGGQQIYSYDSIPNIYKYSDVKSLELPIAVRYSISRFNIFTGVNMAYSFTVNTENPGINDAVKKDGRTKAPTTTTTPTLLPQDFNGRFNMGYVFGVGYMLSPVLQLDARMTQNLTNGSKTEGGKKIYNELYKAPSLQMNISYKFNGNKNKPMKAR